MNSILAFTTATAFTAGMAVGGLFAAVTTSDAATAQAKQQSVAAQTDQILTPMTTGQIMRRERDDCERVYGPGADQCKESVGHD